MAQEVLMNARVKRVTKAEAHETADGDSDWIVVRKLKKRPILEDGKCTGWIRRVIVERANEDLPRQSEAARDEINGGIKSERYQTY